MDDSRNSGERQPASLTFRANVAQVKAAHTPIAAGYRPCYQATIEARGEHGEDVVLILQTFEPLAIDAAFDIEVRPAPMPTEKEAHRAADLGARIMEGQLNLKDPRVSKWYSDVEKHSERCSGGICAGCTRLLHRNAELRAIPGLVVDGGGA